MGGGGGQVGKGGPSWAMFLYYPVGPFEYNRFLTGDAQEKGRGPKGVSTGHREGRISQRTVLHKEKKNNMQKKGILVGDGPSAPVDGKKERTRLIKTATSRRRVEKEQPTSCWGKKEGGAYAIDSTEGRNLSVRDRRKPTKAAGRKKRDSSSPNQRLEKGQRQGNTVRHRPQIIEGGRPWGTRADELF